MLARKREPEHERRAPETAALTALPPAEELEQRNRHEERDGEIEIRGAELPHDQRGGHEDRSRREREGRAEPATAEPVRRDDGQQPECEVEELGGGDSLPAERVGVEHLHGLGIERDVLLGPIDEPPLGEIDGWDLEVVPEGVELDLGRQGAEERDDGNGADEGRRQEPYAGDDPARAADRVENAMAGSPVLPDPQRSPQLPPSLERKDDGVRKQEQTDRQHRRARSGAPQGRARRSRRRRRPARALSP